jgi:hypothetical protein
MISFLVQYQSLMNKIDMIIVAIYGAYKVEEEQIIYN